MTPDQTPPTSAAAAPAHAPRGGWSLERTLPLLMTGLLAVILAIALGLTHRALTTAATEAAWSRLARTSDELERAASRSAADSRLRYARLAKDPALGRALGDVLALPPGTGPDSLPSLAAARAVLGTALLPTDSMVTVELWDTRGRRVAFAGVDAQALGTGAPDVREAASLALGTAGDSVPDVDSATVTPLYAAHGRLYLWYVAPVVDRGRHVGYLARQQRLGTPRTQRTVEGLLGEGASGYFRSADARFWANLSGTVVAPPARTDSSDAGLRFRHPDGGETIAVEEVVAGAPIVLAFELPRRTVLAGAHRTLRRLVLLSLVLLAAGAAAAWLLSRRITAPIVRLAGAADAVARGDYGARVPSGGSDELARLAASFNHMAEEVGGSRRSLEEREAQFRALADAIPQLSWMAGADGTPYWFNERWYEYTGLPAGTTDMQAMRELHDPALFAELRARRERSIAAGEPFEMEHPLRGADGHSRWFLTRIQPVRDRAGRVVRWFGTSTDVQTLRDARETAERLREQAEAANRAKSEFLTVMSHELRTPLNAIGGYAELMELGIRGPITDAQRRDLERIRISQQHLLGLISGVLDLSRIETGRVSYDLCVVALGPFLSGLDSLVAPQAAAKALALVHVPCAPQLAVLADREKLRQIVLNLLSNAVRYTPAGGRVTLSAEPADGETVRIAVQDTGIGIAPDALEHIFEPFVQLDRSLTQGRDGVGLGLAISRDLAHGMGGDITVRSEPGVGSTFTLVLPRAVATEGALAMPPTGEYRAVVPG